MKKITIGAASILLIAMLISLFPVIHCEAADLKTDAVTQQEVIWQRNPRYKEYADDPMPEFTPQPEPRSSTNAATFTDKEDAAEYVRENMKDRKETFSFAFVSENRDCEDIFLDIMAEAFEHTGDPEEGDYLAWQYSSWYAQPYSYWGPNGYTHKFNVEIEYLTTKKQEAKVDAAVEDILDELNVYGKSDYKKIRAVYDYLCENVTYDYKNLEKDSYTRKHTALAALVDKTAVCQGYAVAMYRLLLELDVDVRVIVGISGGIDHAWNIVELDDLYYNVDSTWDAELEEYEYFLRCRKNFGGHSRYLDYETFDFHDDYPMSAKDYKSGVKGTKDKIIYQGSCGKNAKWVLRRDRSLTITGKGAINDYPYNASLQYLAPWVYWEEDIEKIVVNEGITVLGDYNFCDMVSLTSVSLPSTLTEIRESVFYNDTALEQIELPNSLVTIGDGVFHECTSLKSITIPDSVTSMGCTALADCTSLKSVKIGSGLKVLESQMFRSCKALTSIKLSSGLETIEEEAFLDCESLETITIPRTVKTMGGYTFKSCTNLEKVTFLGTTNLERGTFAYCESMKYIHFKADAPELDRAVFNDLNIKCYYPKGTGTWTKDVRKNYYGKVKWIAYSTIDITSQPERQVVAKGATAKFTAKARGEELVYQWQYSVDGKTWENCAQSSAKSQTLLVSATTGKSNRSFRCKITDKDGKVIYTNAARLYVLGITKSPATQKLVSGETAKFTVEATGHNKTYQWQYSEDGVTWVNCAAASAKRATLKFKTQTSYDRRYYRCEVTDSAGNKTYSKSARLYVLGVKAQPENVEVAVDGTVEFAVEAGGYGLRYQWERSKDGGETWENCATNRSKRAVFTFTAKNSHNGVLYRCKITDSVGNEIYTKIVTLTVKP